MNEASRARARRIAALIRSERAKRGPFSIYNRIKEAHIDGYAEHLATVYANTPPTPDELTRSMNLHAGTQPQCFHTQNEVAAASRQRIATEQTRKQIIHDVTRNVIKSMTPREKLALANGEPLPRRFELKIYGGDDE